LYAVYFDVNNLSQDRQCPENVALRRILAINDAVEKQYVLHILCVCLGIQHAMRMRLIILSSGLFGSTKFFRISRKRTISDPKKAIEHKIVLTFSTTFIGNISNSKKN
jgi:hypothetical protein